MSALWVHETVAVPIPACADAERGALGAPAGVKVSESSDFAEVPSALVAVARTAYEYPGVSPVTSQLVGGDAGSLTTTVQPCRYGLASRLP